MFIQSS